MKLWKALSNDPETAGFVIEWPSGSRKSVAWRSKVPIVPTIDAAKQYAATLIQNRLDEGGIDDVERTNVPSLVAAIQRLVDDWNEETKARLYATGGTTIERAPPVTH